jgi:hypothetical protein
MSREVATDDHLDLIGLATMTYGRHRIGYGNLPVRKDIGGSIEELGSNLVEYLALERNTLWEYNVKCRDTV